MIGKLLLAATLALAPAPVAPATMSTDLPPERFRGNTVSVIVFTDRAGINEHCGVAEPPYQIIACRLQAPNGAPVIIMPNPCPIGPVKEVDFYQKIICHEMGHVNGWSGNHEP